MRYLLGIDVGTSGTKADLFDEKGNLTETSFSEYELYSPVNGWAEQKPEDWWNAVCTVCKDIIGKSRINPEDICGIGLTGQMHGLVMLDRYGEVLMPSIIWCDQRTSAECFEITQKVGAKELIDITANPALTGFTASKIMWVKNNRPDIYKKCRHILLPKDYIRYKMTGDFATDVSDASGMQLLDVPKRKWSGDILRILDIDENMLGKVYESPEITGYVSEEAAKLCGLSPNTPVVAGAGDNAAAAVGTGTVADGKAFTTIGTSGVVFVHTEKPIIDTLGRVHTFCCAVPNKWHVMGVTQAAGLSLKWLHDNFCENESYAEMDRLAETVPIGADRLVFLPYLMGERTPHLNPDCRAVFFGLSASHGKANIIRSVLEGVIYSIRDCISVLKEMDIFPEDMSVCGGGSKSPFWSEMLSDVINCEVHTIRQKQGTTLGAAILAGVGTGVYKDIVSACEKLIEKEKIYKPHAEKYAEYGKYYSIYRELYKDLKLRYEELSKL